VLSGAADGRRVHAVADSAVGPLTVVAEDGAVVGLFMDGQRRRPPADVVGEPGRDPVLDAAARLGEYFAGRRTTVSLPLRLAGTPFQRAAWDGLLAVPYGATVSYGELARRIGRPAAVRAAAAANGRNPAGIVVPSHRVVGSASQLTGYGGGLERKRYVLALEAGRPVAPPSSGRSGA
jgi:methylated-DNA-[protein]-cysteine S-methyltransferase